MRLSRAERSLLVDWWFTVDRVLLATILVIVGAGLLLSLAASPSIALKRGLPTFHFVQRHFVFALTSVVLLLAVSLLSRTSVRRLSLAVLLGALALMLIVLLAGAEINGATALAALRRLFAAALRVRQAGIRRSLRLADRRKRAPPDMPAIAAGRSALPACSPACSCCSPMSARCCS